MNRQLIAVSVLVAMGVIISGQELDETERFQQYFGPRVGLTLALADQDSFDEYAQGMFPNPDRGYIPFFTQFGLAVEQRMRLGTTRSHFSFQEIVTVAGLDQGIALPSGSFLLGFRSHKGLEFGLGPTATFLYNRDDEDLDTMISVIYAIGWTFAFQDVYVPISLAVVPMSMDDLPRISVMSGFTFQGSQR